jgi:hypothetical protein
MVPRKGAYHLATSSCLHCLVSNAKLSTSSVGINGPAVRALRMSKGVGATAFAERLQCHRSYLGGIEIGSYRRVSPQMFSKIVAALALEDDRAIRLHPFGMAESTQ